MLRIDSGRVTAEFSCRRDGNPYGWWWVLQASNGESMASAGISEHACRVSARGAAEEKGWHVLEFGQEQADA